MIKIKKQYITFFILLFTSYNIFSDNFNVTNSSDAIPAPAGSLRQAIINLNSTGDPNNLNTITFSDSVSTINLVANLDPISKPVRFVNASQAILDGSSINNSPPADSIGLSFILGSEGSIVEDLTLQNFHGADGFVNPFGPNHLDGFNGIGIRVGRADITIDNVTIRNVSGGNAVGNNNGGTAYGVLSGQDNADRALQVLNCNFLGQFSGGNSGSGANSFGGDVRIISCHYITKVITLSRNNFNSKNTGGNGNSGGNVFVITGTTSDTSDIGQFINTNNNFDCISTGGSGINGLGGFAFTFGSGYGTFLLSKNKIEGSNTNTGGHSINGKGGPAVTVSFYRSNNKDALINKNEFNGTNTGGNSTNNDGGYAATIRFVCSNTNTLSNNKINNVNIGGNGINGGNVISVHFKFLKNYDGLTCFCSSNHNLAEKNSITEFHISKSQPGTGTVSDGQAFGFLVNDGNFNNSILSNSIFGNATFPGIFLRGTGNHNQPSPNITSANFCVPSNSIVISGSLNNTNPNSEYIVQIFNNNLSSDPNQGRIFLGETTIKSPNGGTLTFNNIAVPLVDQTTADINDYITATATLLNGSNPTDTSEFSNPIQINCSNVIEMDIIIRFGNIIDVTGSNATPGEQISLYVDGNIVATTTVRENGTYSFSNIRLNSGNHIVQVKSQDSEGNEIISDEQLVPIPTSINIRINEEQRIIEGFTSSLDQTRRSLLTRKFQAGATVTLTANGKIIDQTSLNSNGTFRFALPPLLPPGNYAFQARAFDENGNLVISNIIRAQLTPGAQIISAISRAVRNKYCPQVSPNASEF